MSDSDYPVLEAEEPTQTYDYSAALYQRTFAGMPAPAHNPTASKEYYRFLFAGVLLVLGCLMPFDGDWSHTGYKSFSGGIFMVIGIGLVWTSWGAIHSGVFRMKWALLAFLPFVWGLLHVIFPGFPTEEADPAALNSWGEVFGVIGDTDNDNRFHAFGHAMQMFGPGKIFVFVGGLLALFGFFAGVFGGAKKLKEQKAAPRRR
ncbi:MAG: hypothetical protein KDC95_13870 [Planctomycetes bacterium]|nr:hypothetical protein [Planctomycetota bacterium]